MKMSVLLFLMLVLSISLSAQVYINEVDYDQPGTDMTEFIELVGPDGSDLTGYTVELVNGNGGVVYGTIDLTGLTIPNDNISGFGFFVIGSATVANVDLPAFTSNAVQNGAPDGLVLKFNGTVVDGFSYEGVLTGNNDITAGMALTAEDLGDGSIGRVANGFNSANQDQFFAQTSAASSPGEINAAHGQVLGGDPPPLISGLGRTPFVPVSAENAIISATVTDDSDVTLVELRYSVNGGNEVAVTMVEGVVADTYFGEIPGSSYTDGDLVEYKVYAEDDAPQPNETALLGFFAGTSEVALVVSVDDDGVMLYDGYAARISGVATVETRIFSLVNLDAYVQDNTAGINVFQFDLDPLFSMTRGNIYTIEGTLDQFSGKSEIVPNDAAADIVDNGAGSLPSPVVATLAELQSGSEALEGQLVAVAAVTNTGGGDAWPADGLNANVQISDDGGTSLYVLRVDLDTEIDGSPEPLWPVAVQGVLGQFDNTIPYTEGYQLLPRDLNDIDVVLAIKPLENSGLINALALHSNYPNPFNPSTTLRFDVPLDNNLDNPVQLTIFNSLGQKVRTLVNERLAAGSYKVEWNGLTQRGIPATSGVYYAQLSMNGNNRTQKMMLVK